MSLQKASTPQHLLPLIPAPPWTVHVVKSENGNGKFSFQVPLYCRCELGYCFSTSMSNSLIRSNQNTTEDKKTFPNCLNRNALLEGLSLPSPRLHPNILSLKCFWRIFWTMFVLVLNCYNNIYQTFAKSKHICRLTCF